jgi:hypothetical protein
MAEETREQALDRLLGHPEVLQDDAFVLDVMHRLRRERLRRQLILSGFGLAGGVFGLLGAVQLAEPIARLLTALPATGTMQAVLLAAAAAAFYCWFMNEDLGLTS